MHNGSSTEQETETERFITPGDKTIHVMLFFVFFYFLLSKVKLNISILISSEIVRCVRSAVNVNRINTTTNDDDDIGAGKEKQEELIKNIHVLFSDPAFSAGCCEQNRNKSFRINILF